MSETRMLGGFPTIRYGEGYNKVTILDFESSELYKSLKGKREITLVPKFPTKFRQRTLRNFRDPNTGIIFGIPTGKVKEDGTPEFQRIRVSGSRTYNLTNPADAKEWIIISNSDIVEGSRNDKGRSILRIFDEEKEAQDLLTRSDKAIEAQAFAKRMKGQELYDFARIVLSDQGEINKSSENIVKSKLLKFATEKPAEFLRNYDSDVRSTLQTFFRALSVGLISKRDSKGYMWRDTTPIGFTPVDCAKFLLKDQHLLTAMDNESHLKVTDLQQEKTDMLDSVVPKSLNNELEEVKAVEPKIEDNALKEELEKLKRENAELKAFNEATQEDTSQEDTVAKDAEEAMKQLEEMEEAESASNIYKGRPITGDRDDPKVWKLNELKDIAVEKGYDKDPKWKAVSFGSKKNFIKFLVDKDEEAGLVN